MKQGYGRHTMLDGRVILPGDRVECDADVLGGAMDKFERCGPAVENIEDDLPLFNVAPTDVGYTVTTPQGRAVANRPMSSAEVTDLTGEQPPVSRVARNAVGAAVEGSKAKRGRPRKSAAAPAVIPFGPAPEDALPAPVVAETPAPPFADPVDEDID